VTDFAVKSILKIRWYKPIRIIFFVLLSTAFSQSHANDNILAHRLFEEGNYVQAGEIFTDPAWKGVALYRSSQWWRAAEAFVRANDAVSAYNLGNCYVKLGYYALALDAYLNALAMDASLLDASHNAELMRQLLSEEDDEKSQRGGRNPQGDEIEKLETNKSPEEEGNGQGGNEQTNIKEPTSGKSEDPGTEAMGPQEDAETGKGGEASKQKQPKSQDQDGSGAIDGETDDNEAANRPSGGSESDTPTEESQAAGIRASLESEQATTQWLNRIQHDSQLFLQRRIKLELKRRSTAGQSAPEGGSSW
jgi:Ca-activated chloride channel family protein